MKLEHASAEKLKSEIRDIVGSHLDLGKFSVFVFGSRATGGGSDRSDIDIGIEGPERIPGHVMQSIKEEVEELPYLYQIDIVDFSTLPDSFKKVAETRIESIN